MKSEEKPPRDKPDIEIVEGDKINIRDISDSTGVAIGSYAEATVTEGIGGSKLTSLFDAIFREIDSRDEDPAVAKEELTQTVQEIQKETVKGEQANPKKLERLLKTLALMASDIFEVTVATLANPAAGVATVIRKVAEKASEQSGA